MAVQSLYRRYRPRRFAELKGQDHVVRALRNAVINHREGQAYLFSGPRGTGKTSTARILAKVLNCQNPVDGEPCCECDSCVSVDTGTSYDVLELDAASNNGVAEIRDVIESAALSSPGRHRVFILDEVHMLSRGAEAALLKTLEEPPEHVVFVLATTDPQKVSETIRSRVQHLQFHLLSVADLDEYVRWVISDAGLDVSDDVIERVLTQGAGSARDTLSALELIAAGGGEAEVFVRPEDVIESLISHDAAAVLTQVGAAMQRGHDPKAFTEQLVRFLREMFLSSMAPQLVQLAEDHARTAADMTARYGVASVVRAIEVLGEALVDIRRAPDPRLVLEVTLVRLASDVVANDTASLLARLERLESGTSRPRDVTGPIPRPRLTPTTPVATSRPLKQPERTSEKSPSQEPSTAPTPATTDDLVAAWPNVIRTLKATQRALFSAVDVIAREGDTLVVSAPSDMHKKKCLELSEQVHAALSAAAGTPITLDIRVQVPRTSHTSPSSRPSSIPNEPAADAPTESVVDEIARQFPGARIVDTSKN